MNIVRINGTTAEQMFQYAFYLALHTHDDQARLDVPDGKWIQSLFRLPYFLKATPEQLARYGRGNLKSRLFSKFKKTDGIVFKEHRKLTGQTNKNILDMARCLSEHGKKMWIRHVLVPGITDDEGQLTRLRAFIDTLETVERVEVLPYHTLGVFKWKELGIPYALEDVNPPSAESVARAREILGCEA